MTTDDEAGDGIELIEETTAKKSDEPTQASAEAGPEPLWGVDDLARRLGRSKRWVYRALQKDPKRKGSIPFVRLPGGGPRFMPNLIEEWLLRGCPPAEDVTRKALRELWRGAA